MENIDHAWILAEKIHLDKTGPLLPKLRGVHFGATPVFSGAICHAFLGPALRELSLVVSGAEADHDQNFHIRTFLAVLRTLCGCLETLRLHVSSDIN